MRMRRRFMLGTLAASAALVVGWGVMPPRQRLIGSRPLPTEPGQSAFNGWLKISADCSHSTLRGAGTRQAQDIVAAS